MEGLLERRVGGGGLIEDDGTCNCSVGLCTSKQTTPFNKHC